MNFFNNKKMDVEEFESKTTLDIKALIQFYSISLL